MPQADAHRGVLAEVLWKVVPPAFAALLAIWMLVGIGGIWVLNQRHAENLKSAAAQQTWAVADNIDHFFDSLRSVADNALTINAFVDPVSVEHFLQPFFRSYRIGQYTSLTITMTDFSGVVMASNDPAGADVDLPAKGLWLNRAIQGKDVLTIDQGAFIAAVPVSIGSLAEGVILVTLSPADTKTLLSSSKHGGFVRLADQERGVLFDSSIEAPSSSRDFIGSEAIALPGFAGLTLSSSVAPPGETPFIGVLHAFLLTAFLADLAALVFGIFMAANLVAGPLNSLVGKIRCMQKMTDPEERLTVEGPRELQNLALAFNRAADRQAELTASVEKALAQEKLVNENQRQFVSLVSHEFRTPLAIIDGQAQRIVRKIDRESREGIVKAMEKCRTNVARLVGLIDSVLSSSRLEAGVIEYNPGACPLVELLVDSARNQESIVPSHKFVLDIDRLPDSITADGKLLRQVVTNLFSNAVKYSPSASTVWVDGYRDGDDIVIAVRDEGVGIPEKEIGKLFSRFFRASTASGIAGTGIGLNLIKQLVELHGGDITVTSVANEGSTFTVRLPIEAAPAIEAEAA